MKVTGKPYFNIRIIKGDCNMLTQTDPIVVSVEPKAAKQTLVKPDLTLAARAVAIGWKHYMPYLILPKLGVISEPVYHNGWLCVPREMDNSYVPPIADKQILYLIEGGIPITQQVIMHEPKRDKPLLVLPKVDPAKAKEAGETLVKVIGVVAGVVAVVGFAMAYAAATAVAIDPALVAVISDETGKEDGLWLVVASWKG
jgi:hypothetical protein